MKVIRKSEKQAHKQARSAHDVVAGHHSDHVKRVESVNRELKDAHAEEKKAHKERLAAYADECKRVDAKHEEQLAIHAEYEKARVERDKKLAEIRKKLPKPLPFPPPRLVSELLNWPREPLPERPAPEHPGYFAEPPEPVEPVLVEPHDEPEFHFPEPVVFDARRVKETETVDTEWGEARALPGSWVLADPATGKQHIEQNETIESAYSPA